MSGDDLAGWTVVVLGGSSGIGFGVASLAAAQGATAVIGSSSEQRVTAAAERLPAGTRGFAIDVTDEDSVAGFFEQVGPLDHLAFTAGDWSLTVGSPAEADLDALRQILSVRLFGAVLAVKHALPGPLPFQFFPSGRSASSSAGWPRRISARTPSSPRTRPATSCATRWSGSARSVPGPTRRPRADVPARPGTGRWRLRRSSSPRQP